jgi:ubiquinone/menaquinone biosynthesis C-methylase UbiE
VSSTTARMRATEFDRYADSYRELLREPIRDRFATNELFFTERKWILLRDFLARSNRSLDSLSWLDVGCGTGDLLRFGENEFGRVAGCDMSAGMLRAASDLDVRLQDPPDVLPFGDAEFDVATAVCVFHHVPVDQRLSLVREMKRILRPGGVVCLIEHNAQNPVVRGMVRRIPVDANAVLLRYRECHDLFAQAGFRTIGTEFFLFLPEAIYRRFSGLETLGGRVPLGGQYAAFATLPT